MAIKVTEKQCRGCGVVKPIDGFSQSGSNGATIAERISKKCRDCNAIIRDKRMEGRVMYACKSYRTKKTVFDTQLFMQFMRQPQGVNHHG